MTVWCDRTLVEGDYVGLSLSEKEFHSALKSLGIKKRDWPQWVNTDANATCHHLIGKGGKRANIVCVRGWEGKAESQIIALLVHEAVHLKQDYMRYIGERNPSDEFEAYVVQNLLQGLYQAFIDARK